MFFERQPFYSLERTYIQPRIVRATVRVTPRFRDCSLGLQDFKLGSFESHSLNQANL